MVTTSDWWQLAGGLFEIGGLLTVALGISNARARFTNRPSILQKIRTSFCVIRKPSEEAFEIIERAELVPARGSNAQSRCSQWRSAIADRGPREADWLCSRGSQRRSPRLAAPRRRNRSEMLFRPAPIRGQSGFIPEFTPWLAEDSRLARMQVARVSDAWSGET